MVYPIRRSQSASIVLTLLLVLPISLVRCASINASFRRDVIISSNNRPQENIDPFEAFEEDINNELLIKSIPLKEYEDKYNKFMDTGMSHNNNNRMLQEENDDFYVEYDGMYSFSGYSMKYVKCQPVQYFSEDAISAGEHSPMITQDIIILRLCPYKSCTASLQYGCYYNYADYAISMKDYLAIMLKYRAKRRDFVCTYCAACGVVYKGDAAADEEEAGDGDVRRLDEAQAEDAAAEEEVAAEEDNVQEEAADDNAGGYDCSVVDSYCYDYDNECGNGEDDPDGYMDYDGYLNYLSCTEVRYNDHSYFVRPRCDGSKGSIKMDAFYDMYCVQYAGNDVSIKSLGVGFREGIFTEFYNSTCIDCSKTDAAPYYNTNSALCNKLHTTSAKCTSDLLYNLFDGEENDSTECSYIESMRFGTYDESGKLSSATNGVTWTSAEVSSSQKIMLSIAVAFCFTFIIYACYLHHAMTNLLIKSLSHRELLPPSRHSRHSSRRSQKQLLSKNGNNSDGSDDWEKPGLV